jgi:hypothetical protein
MKQKLYETLLRKAIWTYARLTRRDNLAKWYMQRALRNLIRFYTRHPSQDNGVNEAVKYLRHHPYHPIPYPFIETYLRQDIAVYKDADTGLPYLLHEGKRLFFKRSHSEEEVRKLYRELLIEQDARSPHCYTDASFRVEGNDTLLDIGCAEGNFSLSSVETAARIVLFEGDTEWQEALKATFAPWAEKVTIVPRWVSDVDNDNDSNGSISIDHYLHTLQADALFIKIDVEGHERQVLKGMQQLLSGTGKAKIALCTYHLAPDYQAFSALLTKHGFSVTPTDGVILYMAYEPPYLRKGLVKGVRKSEANK